MIELDLGLVREHLKADDEDVEDTLIQQYINSAVNICESYCNRKFYQDRDALTADRTQAIADLATAKQQRDNGLNGTNDCDIQVIMTNNWMSDYAGILARCNGIVVDGTITAAILMVVGRLYRVRQDVAAGQNVAAIQIPEGARRILEPYLWVGELGGGS